MCLQGEEQAKNILASRLGYNFQLWFLLQSLRAISPSLDSPKAP